MNTINGHQRRVAIENGMKGKGDVFGLSETHLLGQDMVGGDGGECSVWEGYLVKMVKDKVKHKQHNFCS